MITWITNEALLIFAIWKNWKKEAIFILFFLEMLTIAPNDKHLEKNFSPTTFFPTRFQLFVHNSSNQRMAALHIFYYTGY